MSDKVDVPTVSMSNTKKELLDAYAEVRQRVETQRKELLNAGKIRAEAEKSVAQVVAEKEVESDPIKRLHNLRGSLGKELLELAEHFESEVQTFEQVRFAVENKKEELKSLYNLEVAIGDFTELIAFHAEKKEQFALQAQQEEKMFENEMKANRDEWKKESATHAQHTEEIREEWKQKCVREQEEYDYAIKREREQRRNELEDELNKLTLDISAKKQDFDMSQKIKEEELKCRVETVSEREKFIDELQNQINGLKEKMDKTVQLAVNENTARLTAEFNAKQALEKAKHEGLCSVYQSRLDALEKQVVSQTQQIEQLSASQESAYQKVQDIANRAVDSSRREVVFQPVASQKVAESAI